jgi:hypothetical protein
VRTKAKGRASLIYHAREAEDVDAETVFGMAANAFVQLCRVDPRLERLGARLFDDAAKDMDRDREGKEFNDDIDGVLNAFLRALSPYFLQPVAHKALEWLIRRFRCVSCAVLRLLWPPRW